MKGSLVMVLLLAIVAGFTQAAMEATSGSDFSTIVQQFKSAIVLIKAESTSAASQFSYASALSLGTGFIISHDGYILTCAHVIHGKEKIAEKITVRLSNGEWKDANVVQIEGERYAIDKVTDVALLKINNTGDLPIVKLGDSSNFKEEVVLGETEVIIISFPYERLRPDQPDADKGEVTGVNEELEITTYPWAARVVLEDLIRTKIAATQGSSGGPLFSMRGEVIGVAVVALPVAGEATVFATPINTAKRIIPPKIEFIDFPEEIPADESKVRGTIGFWDPDDSLAKVQFDVIKGDFRSSMFDPMGSSSYEFDPDEGKGSFGFAISCNMPQQVTLEVTLFDDEDRASDPKEFSFECVHSEG